MSEIVVRLAPAKLNLTLAILGRRPDGYHALHSVFVPLALADRLSVAPAVGDEDSLHVSGAEVGPAADNLVLRGIRAAREGVRAALGPAVAVPPLAARLEKRIPVAAGLAGGSSDAAAAILAALECWGAAGELGHEERLAVGASVGSDIPFFLAADPPGAALVEGRGERVTPLGEAGTRAGRLGVLVVTPAVPVATPAVFAAYAAGARPGGGAALLASEHLATELRAGLSPRALLDRAGVIAGANDLLPATLAVVPELVGVRRALMRLLGKPIAQSGSGPSCFVLYPSLDEAGAAAETVRAALLDGRLPRIGSGDPAVVATTLG